MSNTHGSSWIRKDKRYGIYLRDGFVCCYCGKDLSSLPAKYRTLDHVVARENGGCNGAHNLVTCCAWCNSSKQDAPIEEFVTPEIAQHIYLQINKVIDRKAGARVAEAYRMNGED